MPIDPAAQAVIDQTVEAGGPALEELTPAEAREAFAGFVALQGEPEAVAEVRNRTIPGPAGEIPVRIYRPAKGPLPVLVYFHGGGWVIMDVDSHDPLCRALANAAGCVVVSVDYRLAPEHKYPAAAEDCYAAAAWAAANATEIGGDGRHVAIGGDSAGGNLTAVVSQLARDRGGPELAFQLMHCPVTNHDFTTASYTEHADDTLLTRAAMVWFWDHYLSEATQGDEAMASPLRGDYAGLPPALIQTGGYDPLRDEGVAYATNLAEAGVEVTLHNHAGLIHDTLLMFGVIPEGRRNLDEAAAHLRRAFGG